MDAPIFDEEFWSGVRSGGARVRRLALNEIASAEEAMNLHEGEASLFDEEFWSGVRSGAARVRQLALNEIAAAHEALRASKKAAAPWRGVLHWKGWIPLAAPVVAPISLLL